MFVPRDELSSKQMSESTAVASKPMFDTWRRRNTAPKTWTRRKAFNSSRLTGKTFRANRAELPKRKQCFEAMFGGGGVRKLILLSSVAAIAASVGCHAGAADLVPKMPVKAAPFVGCGPARFSGL